MTVQLTTFLSMNGRAKEAISFYQEYLEAKVLFIKNYVELKEMDPTFEFIEAEASSTKATTKQSWSNSTTNK